jgi:hypothetical protein
MAVTEIKPRDEQFLNMSEFAGVQEPRKETAAVPEAGEGAGGESWAEEKVLGVTCDG